MWDSFLDRTTQSCGHLNQNSSSYRHLKTDIFSVESLNYIPKEILCHLDPLYMKDTSKSKVSTKKVDTKSQKSSSGSKQCVPVPIYYKFNTEITDKRCRAVSAPACRRIKDCKCGPKNGKLTDFDKLSKTLEKLIPESSEQQPENTLHSLSQKLEHRKECDTSSEKKPIIFPILKTTDIGDLYMLKEKEHNAIKPTETLKLRKPCDKRVCGEKYFQQDRRSLPFFWQTYWFGERGSGTRTRTGDAQDFYHLRDECLENNTLFEDPVFPADDSSLFFSQRPDRYYEWKRPHEISPDPKFFVEGFSRFDVQQGELGDCWLLAAAANLTLYKRLFFQIIPDDQDFDDKYAGIFHFRFWQYGKWIDIVIDDRLPTYRGQLVYLHSNDDDEFWSALLEKAYAKLNGSYEALKGGSTCEAMEDFTGGVTEMYEMESSPPNLFQIILKAYDRSSLMGCSIEPDPHVLEAQTPEGLVRGHAYSITRVQYIDIQTPNVTGKIPLLRLRNPWGNESEWNGAWSDGAPEWRFISDSQKEELGLTFDSDGEFWISYKDFMKHFSRLEICNLNPDSLSEEELQEGHKKKWEMSVYEGEWVRGVTAGGCRNYLDSFWRNPQYRVTLTDVDDDDEDNQCTMIVGLMQKNRRQVKSSSGEDLLTIGFAIYHLSQPDRVPKPLDMNFFRYNASVARSPSFINLREVSCRFKLPPGTYCIVPSTFDPNEQGEFLLRVFTEKQNVMEYGYNYNSTRHYGGNEVDEEEDEEERPTAPSFPEPHSPSSFHSDPFPSYPGGGYSHPQPSHPGYPAYPQPSSAGYPQPSSPGYPYPGYPSPGYQSNSGGYPGYQQPPGGYYPPPNQYPGYPAPNYPPRQSAENNDPIKGITNFFNKLFK
ncbi:unnamed protein product [Psylliodes chrysocephalus]|uniref:Calpain catalytic domain-containing protein n=1 Tax=Psylliodes chrysocephalus TaxID=3402493 RepID=A0A9P0CW65_9CUCU|nr:unnamed protein product [Psylliodes chrysocephala]